MDLPAGLVKVGEGREAEMFALDDERVLRLYRGGFLRSSAEFQVQALEAARSAGIRVPAVYETTEVDGRVAVVMERIPGPDLLTVIGRQPWRVWWIGRVEGEAHAALGSAIAPAAFPTTHERYERKIRGSDAVPAEMAEAAISRLKTLPEGDRLLHGDFHPGNLMMKDGQPVIIDWSAATRGVPETDFARSVLTTMVGDVPPGTSFVIRFFASSRAACCLTLTSQLTAATGRWTTICSRAGNSLSPSRASPRTSSRNARRSSSASTS